MNPVHAQGRRAIGSCRCAACGLAGRGGRTGIAAEVFREQTFIDRVRTYIPLQVIVFYIFVNSMIDDHPDGPDSIGTSLWSDPASLPIDDWVALVTLAVGVLGVVVFTRRQAKAFGTRWALHTAMSVLAFFVWCSAIRCEAYEVLEIPIVASISALLLGSFTLLRGLIDLTLLLGTGRSEAGIFP